LSLAKETASAWRSRFHFSMGRVPIRGAASEPTRWPSPFGVDSSPQIDHAASDFQIDFIQMPGGVGIGTASAQVRRDRRPKMVPPTPNGLIRDRNATLRQQLFNVAEAQSEPEIQPDRLLNDLKRESVSVVADFLHRLG
jgi:hypothetical protein